MRNTVNNKKEKYRVIFGKPPVCFKKKRNISFRIIFDIGIEKFTLGKVSQCKTYGEIQFTEKNIIFYNKKEKYILYIESSLTLALRSLPWERSGSAALIEHRFIESPQTSDESSRRRSLLLTFYSEFEVFIQVFFELCEHMNLRRLTKASNYCKELLPMSSHVEGHSHSKI